MSIVIPSHEDRDLARSEGVLKKYITAINEEILTGEYLNDGRFNYLRVEHGDKYIPETHFSDLEELYAQQFWIIERHMSDEDSWHLRVFKKRRDN